MRYVTTSTLHTRLPYSPNAAIYIPPKEVVEAETGESAVVVRVVWRGQVLNANLADLDRQQSKQPA